MSQQFMTIKTFGLTSRARLQYVLENESPRGLVLDVGCGGGEATVSLRMRGFEVVGLDKDVAQLESLSALRNMGEGYHLVVADASRLPFRGASFGTIYCMEVINMLESDEEALIELVRVLERNGACTISVPNADYPLIYDPLNKFLERMGLGHRLIGIWSPGVKRLYRSTDLLLRLRRLGLSPIRLDFVGKWLIPVLENYLLLLLYYNVLAAKFRMRFTFKGEGMAPGKFSAISKLLDNIVRLDSIPNLRGTHFIVKCVKS